MAVERGFFKSVKTAKFLVKLGRASLGYRLLTLVWLEDTYLTGANWSVGPESNLIHYFRAQAMKMYFRIFFVLTYLLLAGCQKDISPLVAGEVSYAVEGKPWVSRSLSKQQLQLLTDWLARSNSQWSRCYTTPGLSGGLDVAIRHADGTASSLSLLKNTNSVTTIAARHLSGSNLSEQPCALQEFSKCDIDDLRKLLSVPY